MPNSRRPTQQRSRKQRDYLRCAVPEAYVGGSDSGPHGTYGPQARKPAFATRRCCSAPTTRLCILWHHSIATGNRCNHCKKDTATRDVIAGNIFQDIKTQLSACPTLTILPSARRQFRHQSLWMTAHFRTAHSRTLLSQSRTSAESQQWPFHYLQKFPRDSTETRSQNSVFNFGKQAKFMSFLVEYCGSSTRHLFAREKEPCSSKLMNRVEEELAPSQPEDPSAKP